MRGICENSKDQLFKQSLASVKQTHILSKFSICQMLLSQHHLLWKGSWKHKVYTLISLILFKLPAEEDIWRSKDLLNHGIS